MNDNITWLKTLFAQPYLAHIQLAESNSCKWFYCKHGNKAGYNPKQAAIANPLEFKMFVLANMYNVLL